MTVSTTLAYLNLHKFEIVAVATNKCKCSKEQLFLLNNKNVFSRFYTLSIDTFIVHFI